MRKQSPIHYPFLMNRLSNFRLGKNKQVAFFVYKVVLSVSSVCYPRLCRWLENIPTVSCRGSSIFIGPFRRLSYVSSITYLTKSPHAQTKFGSHYGVQNIIISGYIGVSQASALLALINQLTHSFDIISVRVISVNVPMQFARRCHN